MLYIHSAPVRTIVSSIPFNRIRNQLLYQFLHKFPFVHVGNLTLKRPVIKSKAVKTPYHEYGEEDVPYGYVLRVLSSFSSVAQPFVQKKNMKRDISVASSKKTSS